MGDYFTLDEMAKAIAKEANKCCNRSDGYEENVYVIALTYLTDVLEGRVHEPH